MSEYWGEFLKVALAHLLAVASPGPDFAVVLRQSVGRGRRAAVLTAIGIGCGILVHVGYSLLGLGLLIRSSELWFNAVKYAGAGYIAWLGLRCLLATPRRPAEADEPRCSPSESTPAEPGADRSAFALGFLTNALNPKATLFFISLFALIVDPYTPKLIQAGYGLWMVVGTAAWFSAVAVLFTQSAVRRQFLSYGHWIDRALGVVFLGFAVQLAVSSVQ